ERGVSLLRKGGLFCYIVANKWMRANYGTPMRKWLKDQCVKEIVDFGDLRVFENATTYPCILLIAKEAPQPKIKVTIVKDLNFEQVEAVTKANHFLLDRQTLDDNGWVLANAGVTDLLTKLKQNATPLGEYVNGKIFRGVLTGLNEAFVIDAATREELIAADPKSAELIKPFLLGRDIKRYEPPEATCFLIFTRHGVNIKKYPAIEKYLSRYKEQLMPRPKDYRGNDWKGRKPGSYKWYEIQDTVDYYAEFENPKIIYPNIIKKPEFTFDNHNIYTNQKCFIISIKDYYLLGILNSKCCFYWLDMTLPKLRGNFFEPSYVIFKNFPIPEITDVPKHDRMVALVERMLELHQKLAAASVPAEKTMLQRQIDATDREIDQLVYQLYDLTPEEIKIVEG
ncbi:MAG: TaqI-like C-terminal specificity domain-containing protein, partial [Anaerolineaceae bacterium]